VREREKGAGLVFGIARQGAEEDEHDQSSSK
jgi:hypothetical protein